MVTTVSTTTVTGCYGYYSINNYGYYSNGNSGYGTYGCTQCSGNYPAYLFLSTKELMAARGSETAIRISRYLSIGIVPLLVTFAVITIIQIAQILS